MRMEKQNIPSAARSKVNARFRNYQTDIDALKRRLKSLADDRRALFGNRYTDDPDDHSYDAHLEQRQQLLSGTERLERSSARLQESQRIALETEDIGRSTLADLQQQRETIEHTRMNLHQSEGYVDTSIKTLRGMARRYCAPWLRSVLWRHSLIVFRSYRMATNRIITIAIITVLILLIFAVIYSKFR